MANRDPRTKWRTLLLAYLIVGAACQIGLLGGEWMVQHSGKEMAGPEGSAWLGSDHLGRDLLDQLIQGTRIALAVGVLAAGGAVVLGSIMGLLSGWFGGWVDRLVLWLSSTIVAIPGTLLVIAIASVMDKGMSTVIVAFALASWVGVYRLVRAETRRLRSADFTLAAEAGGTPARAILTRHLLPHLRPLMRVQFSLAFIWAIHTEAMLSFLGIGIVDQPSWGRMIADAWTWNDLGQGFGWRLASATIALAGISLCVHRLSASREH